MSIDLLPLSWAINVMRKAGLTDAMIASILCDIRSATLNEEHTRLQSVARNNPPQFIHSDEIRTELNKLKGPYS